MSVYKDISFTQLKGFTLRAYYFSSKKYKHGRSEIVL